MHSSDSVIGSEANHSSSSSTVPTTPERSPSPAFKHPRDGDSYGNRITADLDGDGESIIQPRHIQSICFVGAGYVGGPTAALIALNNPQIKVTVVDKDERRIRRWNSRHLPIYEPGLGEIVRISRDGLQDPSAPQSPGPSIQQFDKTTTPRQANLFFSSDVSRCISESEIVVIAVNTPTKMRGAGKGSATDMTSFEAVAAEVVRHAKEDAIIVEKSTVPCRTAEMIQNMVCTPPFEKESSSQLIAGVDQNPKTRCPFRDPIESGIPCCRHGCTGSPPSRPSDHWFGDNT